MSSSQPSRIVLVTGASRGLGRAIAEKLAAEGHRVVVNYFSSARDAEDAVSTITRAGGKALALKADVREPAQIAALLTETQRHFGGPVEVLINNATGPQPMKPIEAYTWQDFQDQLDFFVKAPMLLTQATLPEMKKARWGRIIHIGSEVVELGNADFSAYVAAKGAMLGLTRAWATEFGPWQITVNNVAPGWIPVERHAGTSKESLDSYAAQLPLRRQGVPAEIADAVAFIASDASRFITGQTLAVNGGNTF
ncbi:3-oxoacyl-ACP reductase [Nibricoccus aquaticus]|uniref:3-oxoacyl-ACP reductase n=1 Tax=Nibricoccus aquaticus TaxID=2576891 RepID=A0A290Q2R1_9BACT|nr:SDR family oxidoreductase [Nibricoccus aquaticus]ATC62703.1 3-oxoacyl-ACP reductase [Nibricoccus aquaticus]